MSFMLCGRVGTITDNDKTSKQIQHPYREKTDKRILKKNPWRDHDLHLTVLFLAIIAMSIGPIEIDLAKGVTVSNALVIHHGFGFNILPCKTYNMDSKKTIPNC